MNRTAPVPALPPKRHRITINEAAELAKVSRSAIDKWLAGGKITRYTENGYNVILDAREVRQYAATPRGGGIRPR